MRRYQAFAVTTLALLSLVSVLVALSGPMDSSKPFDDKRIPKEVRDALNSVPRVRAWAQSMAGTNGYWSFYYKGKTEVLNQFLERLSKLPLEGNGLRVVLIPEPGKENQQKPTDDEAFDYNWSVCISYNTPFREGGPDSWDLSVEIHINGDIELEKLKLPLAFEAEVAGNLARFVSIHNDRRKDLAKELLTKHLYASSQSAKVGSQIDTRPTSYKGPGYPDEGIYSAEPTTEPSSKPAE